MNLRSSIRKTIEKLTPKSQLAVVGWSDGSTVLDTKPNFLRCTLRNKDEIEVWNDGVAPVHGIHILIAPDPDYPGLFRAQKPRFLSISQDFPYVMINFHRANHTWPGPDTVPIELRQFMPLHPSVSGFNLIVRAGWIKTQAGWHYHETETIDLTTSKPTSGARFVLVSLDPDGVLTVTNGSIVAGLALLSKENIPNLPSGHKEICAVRLYVGQTAIKDQASNTDLIDLRFSSSGPGFEDAPEDGNLYGRQDGEWVELNDGLASATIGCELVNNLAQGFGTDLYFYAEMEDNGDFWDPLVPDVVTIAQEGWYLVVVYIEWYDFDPLVPERKIEVRLNGADLLLEGGGFARAIAVKASFLSVGDELTFESPSDDSEGGISSLKCQLVLLGSGTGEITAGIPEAPNDAKLYGRQSEAWHEVPAPGIADAANDGTLYGRKNEAWEAVPVPDVLEAPEDGTLYGRKNGAWEEVPGVGSLHPIATSGSYEDLENVPSTFPPSAHNHDDAYEAKGFLTVADGDTVTATEVQTIFVAPGALSLDISGNPVIDFSSVGGIEEAPEDGKSYVRKDGDWAELVSAPLRSVVFTVAGDVEVISGKPKMRNRFGKTMTIKEVYLDVDTAPTGQAIIVDINVNGSTIFSTQANRPQIAASATSGSTSTVNSPSFAVNDLMTFDVDQIGSGTAGADHTVTVALE